MSKLNDDNRAEYISKIQKYLDIYLLEGVSSSFQSEDIINFFSLEKEELDVLKAAHFLMNHEVRRLFVCIPNLFRNLSHSTNKDDVECQGIIRGNINWNKTIKARYSRGLNDESLFVCSPPFKHYDLDENRILKFIFKEVIYLYEIILRFNTSEDDYSIDLERLYKESEKWYGIVEEEYRLSKSCINNIYFGGVSDLDFVSPEALNKTQTHKNPIYHRVAKVYELYEKLFILDDMECLIDLVKNQLVIASDNNTLFEIYIFFKIISKLEKKAVKDFEIHLYFKNYKTEQVSAVLDGGTTIKVFYQHVPNIFKSNSKYLKMNKNNRFGLKKILVRRPDIILEISENENTYYRIVEVKNASECKYMRDSFYKMFGYVYDFCNVPFAKKYPYVLVNWKGSRIKEEFKEDVFSQEVIFLNKEEFSENIDMLFEI